MSLIPTNGWRIRTGTLLLAGALLATASHSLWAQQAQAHAVIVRSEPAAEARLRRPPASIDLWFSEPLEARFSSFELLDVNGRTAPLDGMRINPMDDTHLSALPRPLSPGFYTVVYRTLSTLDGHDWSGAFTFTVLNDDGSTPSGSVFDLNLRGNSSPPEIASRWLSFVGLSTILGSGLLIMLTMERRRSGHQTALTQQWLAELSTLARRLALAGVPLAVAGLLLDLYTQQQQFEAALVTLLSNTRFGLFASGQIILLLAGIAALGVATAGAWRERSNVERTGTGIAAVLAGLTLLTVPFVSHAAAAPGMFWALLTDAIHLELAALWVGGLIALAAMLLRARWLRLDHAEKLLPLVTRFSALAAIAIIVLAFTGLVRTLGELPHAGALIETNYGRWLLAKFALVAATLVMAMVSRRVLARFAAGMGARPTLHTLGRLLPVEATLALIVLGAVAVLGQLPNPRGGEMSAVDIAIPFNSIVPADDLSVHLQVNPGRAGLNELRVHAYRTDGSEPGEFENVNVTVSNATLGTGGVTSEAEPQGDGIFTTTTTISNVSPTWTVTTDIRRVSEDDTRAEFQVPIETTLTPNNRGLFSSPAPQLSANTLGATLLAAGGIGTLLATWRSRRRLSPHARTAAVGLLATSIILWLSADSHGKGTPALQNPFTDDAASVERGRVRYATSCAGCHGTQGRGDGPNAVGLSPAPADLSLHVPLHPESDTYVFIAYGFPGTAMTGWAEQLSKEQIWDLVNYLRAEFDTDTLDSTDSR